ncbi:hypothetical protein QAD02_017865 [Eretmocerus hayati]|uniref:Uncharacterized protein n=1 Tax=Eretmocerus hayati TaxID=131215 RepID=A0ACC2PF40_9HYME|nr:hypothetical protein QAD02_017865 [Eretmocerus hayati]
MSTRYLKKVYGSDSLDKNTEVDDQEPIDVQVGCSKQKAFNVFDLLNQNSENESEPDDAEPQEDDNQEDESYNIESKSKKKRRRHKKTHKQKNCEEVGRSAQNQDADNVEDLDEIDRTVRQINKLFGEPSPSTSQTDDSKMYLLAKTKEQTLTVQHKHLNPYNELKRIFGSKTIQAEEGKLRARSRGTHLKKTWLVSVRDDMLPIVKSGISMAVDRTMNVKGVQYFVFEHSTSYRQVQQKFISAVESLDPQNIMSIVRSHPYHVDTLLQSAELCKLSEELAMAANLIERALFYLEYAFHPLFNLTTANCRLDYKKQQNRALFITLFKHLVLVGGRACYRTSLELCKLLLSLDPDNDPLAVVLMIDFYAIRSKEYEWFCEFCSLWENSRNLQQLPNIAYSLALAHFHLGNKETADELLQTALIMFPGVLMPLLDKCSVQTDSKVTSHNFFTSNAIATTSESLEKLQSLYVARSFHLWKEADILPWLENQVHVVLHRVDDKDDYVKFCQTKRSKRYLGKLPRNIMRHLIVSDLKDVTVNIQELQGERSIMSHDPLPPSDSIDIYTPPQATRRAHPSNSNLLSLFFQSFFIDLEADGAFEAADPLNENLRHRDEID